SVPKFRWQTTLYYELPVGRGKSFGSGFSRLLDSILGGWSVSANLNVASGYWMSPYYSAGSDTAGIGRNSGLPDRIANGRLKTGGPWNIGDLFLDPNAFVVPPNYIGRFGNSGYNWLPEP